MATGDGIAAIIKSVDDLTDGWFPIHKAKRQAKADAVYPKTYIEQLRENGIELTDGEAKAFQLMNARNIRSGENLAAILEGASVPEGAPVEQIQDEWYAAWIDGAKDAFSEWNRAVYRKAIEQKAADPESFSRAALGVVSKMDEDDIGAISVLNGLCPVDDVHPHSPMILSEDDALVGLVGLSASKIEHLCDIGILRQVPERIRKGVVIDERYLQYPGNEGCVVAEGQEGFDVMVRFGFPMRESIIVPTVFVRTRRVYGSTRDRFLGYGSYVFTEAGREISELIDASPCDRVAEYIIAAYDLIAKKEAQEGSDDLLAKREFERYVAEVVSKNRSH